MHFHFLQWSVNIIIAGLHSADLALFPVQFDKFECAREQFMLMINLKGDRHSELCESCNSQGQV